MYLTPRSNSSSISKRRKDKIKVSKEGEKKILEGSRLLQKAFGTNKKNNRKTRKRKRKIIQTRPYNVSASRDITSKTYKKQRVSRKQQRIINNRFKNGYSPFVDRVKNSLQLTVDKPNLAKWIWRTGNNLKLIKKAFAHFPSDGISSGNILQTTSDFYLQSQEQSIYFSQIKYIYEIRNPNNYDITVTIYDIVYKEDSEEQSNNQVFNDENTPPSDLDNRDDPLALICRGLGNVTGYLQSGSDASAINNAVVVADPNSLASTTFGDPLLKPTDSYPFNIYCKILKKRIYRLEPGATMTHIFTYKPKALLNRGYMGYKYKKQFASQGSNYNVALRNITCGCLFKVLGQVLNSGNDTSTTDMNQVGYYSGNVALVETIENKWYTMDYRFNYIFNENNLWSPTAAEYATATNPTDVSMATVDEASTISGT